MKGKTENLKSWQPGQSGNPNGRPKKMPKLDDYLAEILNEEKEGINGLMLILKAMRAKAAKGDVKAASLLLDRAFGKASQTININGDIPVVFNEVIYKKPDTEPGNDDDQDDQ
jgi:hypothetical protein